MPKNVMVHILISVEPVICLVLFVLCVFVIWWHAFQPDIYLLLLFATDEFIF